MVASGILRIRDFTVGDAVIYPPSRGLTVIVGGNNVGKTRLVSELFRLALDGGAPTNLVTELRVDGTPISETELEGWLSDRHLHRTTETHSPEEEVYAGGGVSVSVESNLVASIDRRLRSKALPDGRLFAIFPNVTEVVGAATQSFQYGTHHALLATVRDSPRLKDEFFDLARRNFGLQLFLDTWSASTVVRVGRPPIDDPRVSQVDHSFRSAVTAEPLLEREGNGVQSFLGAALHVMAGPQQIVFFDEPDAFLNPAQAKALGAWMRRKAFELDKQLIVVTHRSDFLIGGLSCDLGELTIVRLDAADDLVSVTQLPPEKLAEVYADPVLRYSNTLQSVFHRRAIVAEADGDCRFYQAAIESAAEEGSVGFDHVSTDIAFVPSSGHQAFQKHIEPLVKVGVKVDAIADFDLLRERRYLQKAVEALDANFQEFGSDWATVDQDLSREGGWIDAKQKGVTAVTDGVAMDAAKRLLENLAAAGLHVVPTGELESFDGSSKISKRGWVSEALKQGLHKKPEARDFVTKIVQR